MVLAVARPGWSVVLLDSLRKRCDFLERAAAHAGIPNVSVVWARAEDAGRAPAHRDVYDLATARAVAETRVLAELCLPFVRPGGSWLAAKGAGPQAEVAAAARAIKALGGEGARIHLVDSFAPDGQRTAVTVRKAAPTPVRYPRPAGTPSKQPL
jgi:16S rRNA G527 N7-methylase RsmG